MLLFDRRFGPLFVTQFFGAFNDNCLKVAILTLLTFKLNYSDEQVGVLTNLAMALFILPYFLFSGLAGELADKYNKAPYCRWIKIWEIGLMLLAGIAFPFHAVWALYALLFLMGTQSTFFSPAKYSLLPQQLPADRLIAANAWMEAGTYLAILGGMIAGGVVIMLPDGELITGGMLLAFALVGFGASCLIPSAPPLVRNLPLHLNLFADNWRLLKTVWELPKIRFTVLASSLFWAAGALIMSQMPLYCRAVLGGNNSVFTLSLALFSIGVGAGSCLCSRLLRGAIHVRMVWIGGAAMTVLTAVWMLLSLHTVPPDAELMGIAARLASGRFWLTLLLVFGIAVGGGVFAVPLQALMQHRAPPDAAARVIAGNNLYNAFYMGAGSLLVAALMNFCGVPLFAVILGIAVLELVMTVYTWKNRNME